MTARGFTAVGDGAETRHCGNVRGLRRRHTGGSLIQWLQDVTAGVAASALAVSFWQGRRARQLTRQANARPVIENVFDEFRKHDFRRAMDELRSVPEGNPADGFAGMLPGTEDDAYAVCYLFEYIGLLVAFRHLDRDLIMESMSSQLLEIWRIMRPWIAGERAVRQAVDDPLRSKGFLPHYEHLVALIIEGDHNGRRRPYRKPKIKHLLPGHELSADHFRPGTAANLG